MEGQLDSHAEVVDFLADIYAHAATVQHSFMYCYHCHSCIVRSALFVCWIFLEPREYHPNPMRHFEINRPTITMTGFYAIRVPEFSCKLKVICLCAT